MGDEVDLLVDGRPKHGESFVFLFPDLGEVTINEVVEEGLRHCLVLVKGGELEGSHPNVRASGAGKDGSGQFGFTVHTLSRRNDRQASGCGYA